MIETRSSKTSQLWYKAGLATDLLVFALASAGTYFAQQQDRPITAVLIYLSGVLIVGARSGLYRGLIAAVLASLVYNFFLSEPVFRFGASSLDEVVPLLAFNLSAIFSGALAGRLKDSAIAARAAESENALLLNISDSLQKAVQLSELEGIVRLPLSRYGIGNLELYVRRNGALYRPAIGEDEIEAMVALLPRDKAKLGGSLFQVRELGGAECELGFAKFIFEQEENEPLIRDLQPVANLLGLAVDRCLLLEELSEARAHQRSEELKSAILASVSHDLRTPLTAIEAAASSLRSYELNLSVPQRADMLSTINEQCRRLNRYTANLISMGRIQSGILPNEFEEIDLVEILGVALGTLRENFPARSIRKHLNTNCAVVRANGPMLEQAIYNVLENAMLHGSDSEPLVIALTPAAETVRLDITDNGPGISLVDLPHVFERFYRSNQPSHRSGSGLGLYIAKGFINAFGGTIDVTSPVFEGKGTCVAITLPFVGNGPSPELLA